MTDKFPTVYILFGEDEYEIDTIIRSLQEKMGDASMATMNTSRIDGRRPFWDELRNNAFAAPFLVERRLVIIENPLTQLKTKENQAKFKELLEKTPETTALVIVEQQDLNPTKRSEKPNWLFRWAQSAGDRTFVKRCDIPRGAQMGNWIRQQAKKRGGEMTPEAAGLLASLVVDEPRMVVQEIDKLLAYVNYKRPVEPDDVEYLTVPIQQPNIFYLVDAMGSRKGKTALDLLHQNLEDRHPLEIFSMIVRQFRLLLLTRELVEQGALDFQVSKTIGIHPYVAKKLVQQAQNFDLPLLESVYRSLLDIDEQIKTGRTEPTIAMDTLIAQLTGN